MPRHRSLRVLLLTSLALALPACEGPSGAGGTRASQPSTSAWSGVRYTPDLPISHPPFDRPGSVQASWKQRVDVPYVFVEHLGSYLETGALIPVVHRELAAQGLEPDGPPFVLFYDDPATIARKDLRSRACIPIRGARAVQTPLGYDVLPSTTVGYAFVSGPYPEAPRAYPGIFEYLAHNRWERDGPIREIYLVPPGSNPDGRELLCEIQIPARPRTD